MTPGSLQLPLMATKAGFRRFSVAEYHWLTEQGFLTEDDNLELIEGCLIFKMVRNPPHGGVLHQVLEKLAEHRPVGWEIRIQAAVTLPDSEPEPDLAVVLEDPDRYRKRHPGPADIGLVIEAVSVECMSRAASLSEQSGGPADGSYAPTPGAQVRMYCFADDAGAGWRDAGLYQRDALASGALLEGPAIIAERNATTVIEPSPSAA